VRDLLPARVIATAGRRALSIGLGADRVLICADVMTEEGYLTALATSLGTFFDPLEDVSRAQCPLSDDQLIQATAAGLLPLREGDQLSWIIAPRCLTARNLANLGSSGLPWPRSFRLTSPDGCHALLIATRKWRSGGARPASFSACSHACSGFPDRATEFKIDNLVFPTTNQRCH
jgi:hypothetical protein